MPQKLEELTIREVSLVDRPANSEKGIPRARIALFKRDDPNDEEFLKAIEGRTQGGTTYPSSDYAYVPDAAKPSTWKLRLTKTPGGDPDPGIIGAACAALGKGFRGNKVQIPASALPAVKARVRAAWHKANPDKGSDELPDVLQKGDSQEMPLTLDQVEKKMEEQGVLLTTLKSDSDVLKAENVFLKVENEEVLRMSKSERSAYASMDTETRKAYMSTTDVTKKKTMMDAAQAKEKEKAMCDTFDDDMKKRFNAAGPTERAMLLEKAELALKKKGKVPPQLAAANNEAEDEADGGADEADEKEKAKKVNKALDIAAATADRVIKTEQEILKVSSELAQVRKRERILEFTKRAEVELPNTTGSDIEKGEMLMTLADSLPGGENGEAFKKILSNLKAADKALKMQFHEVGKGASEPIPAEKIFFAKVEEIQKRDSITQPKAIEKTMAEHPELYIDYEAQHRRAIAGR